MNKAVFLDRDGVINKELFKYVEKWAEFEFLPNAIDALKRLSKTDYKIIIITSQSGIAKGLYTKEILENVHKKMLAELAKHNIRIDLIRYCPHKKEDECECKKPKPGMIIDAAKMLDLDLDSSWLIGDKTIDIKSAENASKKIKTILVRTGFFGKEPGHVNINPDFIAEDILDAVNIILKASHQ